MSSDPAPDYRFAEFTVSPARRVIMRGGVEVPIIPRYFDLLLLLLRERGRVVTRREILDVAWNDVVVSDGALSQAVRTLRRALADDPRTPRFIRTVSRHGYRWVFDAVVESADDAPRESARAPDPPLPPAASKYDPFESELARLLSPAVPAAQNGQPAAPGDPGDEDLDPRRDAAERLHALGTGEALKRLGAGTGRERALALLRDTRWDVAGSGPVPLLGTPGALGAIRILVGMRFRRAARAGASRWAAASAGGALAGAIAGFLGGLALHAAPGGDTPASVPVALGLVAVVIGGVGAAGVGAGLAIAEALARSWRGAALVFFGALGGGMIGSVAHLIGRWTLEGLFGHDLSPVGGGFEGLCLGAAAGMGYAMSTPRPGGGGLATPRGRSRAAAIAATGLACGLAGMIVTWAGGNLGGVSLDFMARSFQGSRVGLAPLSAWFGEPALGPITRTVLGAYEGLFFGAGLAAGLTRRPKRT